MALKGAVLNAYGQLTTVKVMQEQQHGPYYCNIFPMHRVLC